MTKFKSEDEKLNLSCWLLLSEAEATVREGSKNFHSHLAMLTLAPRHMLTLRNSTCMVIEFVTRKILFGNNLIQRDLMIKSIDPTRFHDKELFFSDTRVSMELVKKKENKEGNVQESKDKDSMQSICLSMGLERLVSGGM